MPAVIKPRSIVLTVAAEAAREKGPGGALVHSASNTTQQPALATLRDRRDPRKFIPAASCKTRAEKEMPTTISPRYRSCLVEIRRCQAKLLGFPNYAAWKMADQMAKTPQAALSFMRGISRQRVSVLTNRRKFRTSLMVSRAATPFRPD